MSFYSFIISLVRYRILRSPCSVILELLNDLQLKKEYMYFKVNVILQIGSKIISHLIKAFRKFLRPRKLHTVSHFRWKIENTRPGIWLPFEITVIFAFGQGFANLSAAYVWLQPPLKLPHVQLGMCGNYKVILA